MTDDFTATALQTSQASEEAAYRRWLGSSDMPVSAPQTPDTLRALLHERAAVHGIDPLLAEALVSVESGMNPRARSPSGAMGLMQLMPGTVARFQVQDPWDPQQNIDGGMQYLKFLKETFPGRLDLQLASYNAGEGAVKQYGNTIPPYAETQKYVPAVLAKYEALRGSPYVSKRAGTGAPGDMAPVAAPPGTTMQDEAAYRAWLGTMLPPGSAAPASTPPQSNTLPDAGMVQAALNAPGPQPPSMLPSQEAVNAALPAGIGDTQRAPQYPPSALPSQEAVARSLATPVVVPNVGDRTLQDMRQERPVGARMAPYRAFQETEGVVEPRGARILGGIGQGALDLVASTLDFVPAIEQTLGLHGRLLNVSLDTERLSDLFRQIEAAVKPSLNGQAPDFVDRLSQAVGTSLVSIIPAASVGSFLEGLATVAPRGARVGAALTGGVIEGAGEAGDLYKNLVPLVGEDEAAKRALKSFAANVVLVTVTDKYGIFGERASFLRKTMNGVFTNTLQEGLQYDIERRGFVVPADHPQADTLKLQGWEQRGAVLFKPFVLKDAAEVMAIGALIGGPASASVALAAEQQVPAVRDLVEQERQTSPDFTFAQGLDAAQSPETSPPGVDQPTWQRWAQAVLDLLPEPSFGPTPGGLLTSERGSTGAPGQGVAPGGIPRTPALIQADIDALDAGGASADEVAQRLGVDSPQAAYRVLFPEMADAQAAEAAPPPTVQQASPELPGTPSVPAEPSPRGPTLRAGAEVLTPEQYRTPSGGWRIPLGDIPPHELELQDFLRQPDEHGRRGIKLSGEELQGELAGLVSLKETQVRGLQNNRNGLTLQQMAERAQQMGFIRTADKEALLEAMDRSITQGHRVYSAYATGTIPLLHDPFVRAAYQHTLDAIDTLEGRTEEQRRGTRPHAQAIAEGQALVDSGLLNMEDVRALLPGTTLDDANLAAVILRLRDVTTAMEQAAQRFADTGYRVGSPEEDAVLSIMGMFAEVHPKLQGVVAEQGRGLSLLNNPMSAYTGFYNDLRQLLLRAPGLSTRSLADKILATATPEARLVQTPQETSRSIVERFQDQVSILHDRVLRALDNLNQPERHASALRQGMEDLATRFRALQSERTQEPFRSQAAELAPQVEQLATDVQRALDTPGDAATLERVRRRLEALLEQMPRTLPLTPGEEQARLDALHADLAAFPSTRTQLEAQLNAPLSEPGLPFPLELTPETTPQVPHTPEEQARIDAAYQTSATARTPAEWRVIDRERGALSRQQAEARWWQTHGEILAREQARIEQAGPLTGPLARAAYPWEPPALQPDLPLAVPRVLSPAAQASIEASRPGFAAMFREQHTAAMLGPRSWIRNTIGAGYTTAIAPPVRLMASLPGMFHEGGVTPSETAAMLWGEAHGVHEMWSALAHAWATGESMTEQMAGQSSTPGGKTDVFPKATTAANLRALGVHIDPDSMAGKFFDFWAEWIGFSGWGRQSHRIMNSVDEFGVMANFLGQRNVLAYREAMAQGQMDVRAWSDNYARVATDPAVAARISQEAFQFAEAQMLHNALQPGRLGHWIAQLSDVTVPIPGTQQEFPIGAILMPFKKIPINGAKFAVEQSILGLATRNFWGEIAKGGPAADVAIGKMLVGTSIMGAAALLVAKGLLTGRAPEDKIQREVWMRGRQEYSARLPGGLWLDYRVDPIGQDLAMLTDFVQIMGNAHVAPEVFDRLPTALFVTLNKDLWSATAARTIADFFGAVMPNPGTGGELVTKRFLDWAQRTGLSAIPVLDSASLRAWQRYDDPVKHETKTLLDKLYAMIPVWSRDVPAKRTLGGEKQLYGYGVGPEGLRPFLRALNPLAMMEEHLSPADKAIEKYQMQLSYAPKSLAGHALPAGQEVSAQVDMAVLQGLQLTPRQYERFEVFSAGNQQEAQALGLQLPDKALELPTRAVGQLMGVTPPKKAMGLTDVLDWLVATQRWKDEEDAKQQVGQARDPYFEKYFAQIVHTYRQTGLQLLLAQDSDLRKQYYNAVMERGIMALPPSKREDMLQRLSGKVPLDARQIREQLGIASPPAEAPAAPGPARSPSNRDILERIGVGR